VRCAAAGPGTGGARDGGAATGGVWGVTHLRSASASIVPAAPLHYGRATHYSLRPRGARGLLSLLAALGTLARSSRGDRRRPAADSCRRAQVEAHRVTLNGSGCAAGGPPGHGGRVTRGAAFSRATSSSPSGAGLGLVVAVAAAAGCSVSAIGGASRLSFYRHVGAMAAAVRRLDHDQIAWYRLTWW
jgi:hypothetical protein